MYYNARYYNPQTGLFIQADSVDDGLNKYQYVASNPVNNTDPSGNNTVVPPIGDGSYPLEENINKFRQNRRINLPGNLYVEATKSKGFFLNMLQSEQDKTATSEYFDLGEYSWIMDVDVYWGELDRDEFKFGIIEKRSNGGGGYFPDGGDKVVYGTAGDIGSILHEMSHYWFEKCIVRNDCGIDTERFQDTMVKFTIDMAGTKSLYGTIEGVPITPINIKLAKVYILGKGGDSTQNYTDGFEGFLCKMGDDKCINNVREIWNLKGADAVYNYYQNNKSDLNLSEMFASWSSGLFGQKLTDDVSSEILFPHFK